MSSWHSPSVPRPETADAFMWWRHPVAGAATSAILVFLVAVAAQWFVYDGVLHEHGFRLIDPTLAALMSGFLAYRFLSIARRSRLADFRRFEIIGLLNHHIRNALQVILFDRCETNKEQSEAIQDAVARIEWVLADVLPHVQDDHDSKKIMAA